MHRCNWRDICYPVDEGGLGIKSLELMLQAFHIKNDMLYIKNKSLLANFLHSKYSHPYFAIMNSPSNSSSHVWKMIHKHLKFTFLNSKWSIGKGYKSF